MSPRLISRGETSLAHHRVQLRFVLRHRAKFKCDHAFVSTVNGTIGIEFVGQPGPAPVSESSASTDITSQTNDTPCQELRFFECRNYDDRRDPRVLLAFLGWKLAVKKGIL